MSDKVDPQLGRLERSRITIATLEKDVPVRYLASTNLILTAAALFKSFHPPRRASTSPGFWSGIKSLLNVEMDHGTTLQE